MHLGRKSKLSRLLEDSPEKWYWLGFLLADGHFSKNGRIKLTLSNKDSDHLLKFRNFIGVGNIRVTNDYSEWHVMDVSTCNIIKAQFSISSVKTYSPPELYTITEDQMFCLSIGFIDGDGTIYRQYNRRGSCISIKVHSSWLETLQIIFPKHKPYIQNNGYAVVNISDTGSVREYKKRAKDLSLPVLERKWSNIDEDFVSRQEKSNADKLAILQMLQEGFKQKEISSILGISPSNLSQLIKRNNLKEL